MPYSFYNSYITISPPRWSVLHHCSVTGCRRALVIDAGMKPSRKCCMAMWSGVRDFEVAGLKIVTGCTAARLPKKVYCAEHAGEPTPVADRVGP